MKHSRIIVVDDHSIVRVGLKALIEKEPEYKVVGEAADGREGADLVDRLQPDAVIMDIAMPGLNGIEATLRIKKQNPQIKILILSMHLDKAYVSETLRAGASAYLVKEQASDELVPAIKAVLSGKTYLSPGATDLVLQDFLETGTTTPEPTAFTELTKREREVLQAISEGKSVREIGESLHISPKTVETHRRNIMERLNIRSVAGLTRYAIRHGLTSADT